MLAIAFYTLVRLNKNKWLGDFPGGLVVKNLPWNAGDVSSIPGQGTKIPHATEQLSQHITAREPVRHNERSCLLQLRHTQINKINIQKKKWQVVGLHKKRTDLP